MANKYFVAGGVDNDWSGTDNWSTLSGGSGGAGVPGTGDDVFIDGNSPSTCNIDTNANARDFNTTGWTGTLDFNLGDHYLRTYGDVTISSTTTWNATGGTGLGYLHLYDDTGGGTLAINSTNLNMSLRIGGANTSVSTWTNTTDWTFTGPTLYFSPVSHTSYDFTMNQTGDSTITWNPTAGNCYFSLGSYGEFIGDAQWKITGTANLRWGETNDGYRCITNKFEIATGGAVTLFGASSGNVCRIGGHFELKVTGTGTITGDPVTTSIPYFYHVSGGESDTSVAFNDSFQYRMYFRQSSSTQYWQDDSTGITFLVYYKVYTDGSKLLYSNNGKLDVAVAESLSLDNTWYFRGDSGMKIHDLNCTTISADTMDFRWGYNASDAARWEITTRIRIHPAQSGSNYGIANFQGEHATLKSRFYIWHKARINCYHMTFVRVDMLSEGQAYTCGGDPTITDCTGVNTEMANKSAQYDDGTAIQPHTYYTNQIYDPVTVSGTVELSATPQANARVHVVTGQTDEDGNEYLMLRHVLVTNGSGQWTCSVPRNSTVYVSAHYDSGATKYNSLSKPYISAT